MFAPGHSIKHTQKWIRDNGQPDVPLKDPNDYVHPRSKRFVQVPENYVCPREECIAAGLNKCDFCDPSFTRSNT